MESSKLALAISTKEIAMAVAQMVQAPVAEIRHRRAATKASGKMRRYYGKHYDSENRFSRKTAQHGGGYAPGKLFKGHRI